MTGDRAAARNQTTLTLPLSPGNRAMLTTPHPLTPEEWAQLQRVLEAMRPGLVRETEEAADVQP